jgi:cysteinyl-tRNA synthetase
MLRLHDTATGTVRELDLREPGRVSMYLCGPTVYDLPHVGHGRYTLVWDVVRRYLTWSGFDVHFVSNVTDIDDNIIVRAEKEGRPTSEVAEHYEAEWYRAMDALGVQRPDADPHATAYVGPMLELVGRLVDAGVAYETGDGVYFSVERVEGYGLLARQSLTSLRSGARIEVDEQKRSPLDFVLWKRSKPGEPSWDSPWGPGRPGWHTECVVMSLDLLGEGFDLHGGGIDLAFPHHENERAQAVALGHEFARLWGHSGHAMAPGGEKMSKSLGNFTSLTDLLARTDPRAYRLLVLRSHYRAPMEVQPTNIADAEAAVAKLDNLARRAAEAGLADDGAEADPGALARFRSAMDDDLDTPRAMALLFDLVRRANTALDGGDGASAPLVAAVCEIAVAVGLPLGGDEAAVPPEVTAVARRRDEARSARDWGAADAARDELAALGWAVEDTPGGTRVRRR